MGADRESYRSQQVERKDLVDTELFEENVPSFMAFREVLSQCRIATGPNKLLVTGLDYTAVLAHLDHKYKENKGDLYEDILIMEPQYMKARNG